MIFTLRYLENVNRSRLCTLFECYIGQFYGKHHFLLNCSAMLTIARLEVLLISQRKVLVKHTNLIDKCKKKRKILLLLKPVKTILK